MLANEVSKPNAGFGRFTWKQGSLGRSQGQRLQKDPTLVVWRSSFREISAPERLYSWPKEPKVSPSNSYTTPNNVMQRDRVNDVECSWLASLWNVHCKGLNAVAAPPSSKTRNVPWVECRDQKLLEVIRLRVNHTQKDKPHHLHPRPIALFQGQGTSGHLYEFDWICIYSMPSTPTTQPSAASGPKMTAKGNVRTACCLLHGKVDSNVNLWDWFKDVWKCSWVFAGSFGQLVPYFGNPETCKCSCSMMSNFSYSATPPHYDQRCRVYVLRLPPFTVQRK